MKRKNPYTALLEEIKDFVRKIKYPPTTSMYFWSLDKLTSDKSWRLDDVYQRTQAAQSLGYEVIIKSDEKGMEMKYRKIAQIPGWWAD